MNLPEMSDEQLQRLARDLHEQVETGCFSSRDHLLYTRAIAELESRGFDVELQSRILITRN